MNLSTCRFRFVVALSLLCLVHTSARGAVRVEIVSLEGTVRGELTALDAERATLVTESGEVQLPASDILQISPLRQDRFVDETPTESDATRTYLTLSDGSRLSSDRLAIGLDRAILHSPRLGDVELPVAAVRVLRFANGNPTVMQKWQALLQRELKKDLLVIFKGESIDFIEGIVGQVDDEQVRFLLDGEEIPVKRDKVFGVIFNRPASAPKVVGELSLDGDHQLKLSAFAVREERAEGETPLGVKISVPLGDVQSIDLRAGRVAYLSDLEPRQEDYTPFFETVWKMRRDRNIDGGPLRVGGRVYSKGLCLHSRTVLSYRLLGEYRRFQAWMGIDDLVAPLGHVHVVIKADDKILFEGDVRGSDPPRRIDADISGARNLEILVDFGADLDIADHLDLADARLIK